MNKENYRPKFSVRPSHRGKYREIRHHHPGTRRRPDPRVRLLSSIVLVPPRDINAPTTSKAPEVPAEVPIACQPSTSLGSELEITSPHRRYEPAPSCSTETSWRTPESMVAPPTNSPWRRQRCLIPKPTVNYSEEFRIIPGEAYQPVPRYINRDLPWELNPIDIPVDRKVRFYRNDVSDPRMHDLRVEVTPLDRAPSPEPEERLFQSPRRPMHSPTPTSDVLGGLVRLLDQSYGCLRPKPQARPEYRPSTSVTIPPADQSPSPREDRLSESLKELIPIARLFEGPPPDTMAAYRRYKRPPRTRRE